MKLLKYRLFYCLLTLLFLLTFCAMFSTYSFASDPKFITTINSSLKKIQSWIIKISTPAAAVAVGTGVLMKKFSFGDEQRITTGKRLIRSSLFSYAFILSVDLILSTISGLIKG